MNIFFTLGIGFFVQGDILTAEHYLDLRHLGEV
ncbi:hypothetical protein [Borreliella kurtenbachii]